VSSTRKIAVVAGVFFLITEITALAGRLLHNPVLSHPGFIVGSGADTRVFLGALSEMILAIAVIGTAVTLYPIVKRQNESVALGYVCGRLLEAVIIVAGIISVLAVVTLRHNLAGAGGRTVAKSLVAIHDWTFLLGPALILGANTLLLAYLMYTSGLVPRVIAILGLVGGPLIFCSAIAVLFGSYKQTSAAGLITAVPVFAWEVSLAVWLIVKGFKPSPIVPEDLPHTEVDAVLPPAPVGAGR
jgi:hypothetical protein